MKGGMCKEGMGGIGETNGEREKCNNLVCDLRNNFPHMLLVKNGMMM